MRAEPGDAFFDWNEVKGRPAGFPSAASVMDDSLRGGCLRAGVSPSPQLEAAWLERMHAVGVDVAAVPLPVTRVARARLARLAESSSSPRFACMIDASPSSFDSARDAAAEVPGLEIYLRVAAGDGGHWAKGAAHGSVPLALLVEDAASASAGSLARAFDRATGEGAVRVCLGDDAGLATPGAVRTLLEAARAALGPSVLLDFRGESRVGLALVNALTAFEAGADRVHTSALGVGERATAAATELVLLNAELLGGRPRGAPSALASYCDVAARALGWEVPINYPLVGRDAFRTATGVHAAAIVKALAKGDLALADRIYSGVPARLFGRRQEIGIGFLSGASNVVYYLTEHGIKPDDTLVATILRAAKSENHLLTDPEIQALITAAQK